MPFLLATNGDGFLASERVRSKPCDNLFTCSSTYVAKRSNVYIGLSAAARIVQTSGQAAFPSAVFKRRQGFMNTALD